MLRPGRQGITQERGILVEEEHYLILSYLIQHYRILSPAARSNPNHFPTLST